MPDAQHQNHQHVVAKGVDHPPVAYAKAVVAVCHGLDVGCLARVCGKLEKGALDAAPRRRVKPVKLPLGTGAEGEPPRHLLARSWSR